MKFDNITVCLDMYGCPNRCKHCWIRHTPNGNLTPDDLKYTAEAFRPFTDCLTIDHWYREPDFKDNYKELWKLCGELSDRQYEHFELISVWRIVRDPKYVKWLSSMGLKNAQLTLFGGQKKTDFYTGRKNAYNEILDAIEILLKNRIAPRIQVFVNKDNIDELPIIGQLIQNLELDKRCAAFGGEFSFFLHQGSCDGENEKLYDIRVTPDDLDAIPQSLAAYTLRHFGKKNLSEVFGKTEQEWYQELICDTSTKNYASKTPVFFVDKDFNVYPNITSPEPIWRLGNLKNDGAEKVLENYVQNQSTAQHTRLMVPLCEIVRSQGDSESMRLFDKNDYIEFLLNRYCRK